MTAIASTLIGTTTEVLEVVELVACNRSWNGIALAVETAGASASVTTVGTADAGVVTVLEVCDNLEAGCATDTGAVVALKCNRSSAESAGSINAGLIQM